MFFSPTEVVILQRNLAKSRHFKSNRTFVSGGFLLSWLISLFVLLGLSGCGSDTSSSTASYHDTASAKTVAYKLYNEELDFVGNTSSDEIDLTKQAWYEADSAEPYDGTYEGSDEFVRLYAIPNVKEVRTQEDLENIALDLDGSYILLNDITLEDEWTPIGDDSEPFEGILNSDTSDGERYAIKSLKITLPSIPSVAGLFGTIKDALIKNIGVEIANLIGDVNIGGIAGKAIFSNITNSYVIGNISGSGYVGGIVGHAERNNTISNSYADVTINAVNDVGGLVGYVGDSIITNSYATGSISGSVNVGGIAGFIDSSIIASVYAASDIKGNNGVGGIAGALLSGNLTANIVIDVETIGNNIKQSIVGKIVDPILSVISNNVVNDFLYNLVDKILSFTIDKALSQLNDEYVYKVKLGWNFGKDDANPWIIPEGGGTPILYWQAG